MTVGEQAGSATASWSVGGGTVSGVAGRNRAGTGSTSVTVLGGGLGQKAYSGMARVGQTGCEGTAWESETSVRCLDASGVRGTGRVVMTVGGVASSVSAALSYDAGAHGAVIGSNGVSTGSVWVSVSGRGLGTDGYSVAGRWGVSGCEASGWVSETAVECMVGSGGSRTLRTVMTVGQSRGSMTEGVSVCSPSVSGSVRVNEAGTGSQSITVVGAGMGASGYSGAGRSGSSACENSRWTSETSMVCMGAVGGPGTVGVSITSWGVMGTVTGAVTADAGFVSTLVKGNGMATGR
eukprot:58954-Rhodomonas_salina.1